MRPDQAQSPLDVGVAEVGAAGDAATGQELDGQADQMGAIAVSPRTEARGSRSGHDDRLSDLACDTDDQHAPTRLVEGVHVIDLERAAPYLENELIERRNDHVVLTERGMLVANEVAIGLT